MDFSVSAKYTALFMLLHGKRKINFKSRRGFASLKSGFGNFAKRQTEWVTFINEFASTRKQTKKERNYKQKIRVKQPKIGLITYSFFKRKYIN